MLRCACLQFLCPVLCVVLLRLIHATSAVLQAEQYWAVPQHHWTGEQVACQQQTASSMLVTKPSS
jgi:hypothetical protein